MLTSTQQLNETLMISLRTSEGIDLDKIEKIWGEEKQSQIKNDLKKYINHDLIRIENNHAQLTDEGMLRADGIAADLFV